MRYKCKRYEYVVDVVESVGESVVSSCDDSIEYIHVYKVASQVIHRMSRYFRTLLGDNDGIHAILDADMLYASHNAYRVLSSIVLTTRE